MAKKQKKIVLWIGMDDDFTRDIFISNKEPEPGPNGAIWVMPEALSGYQQDACEIGIKRLLPDLKLLPGECAKVEVKVIEKWEIIPHK